MKCSFFLLFFCCTLAAAAQPSDFMTLKKKGRTIRTYFAGSRISFVTTSGGSYSDVLITGIRNDSLSVNEFIIVQVPTRLGVYVPDTAARYRYQFHYKELGTVFYEKKGFSFTGSGSSLMVGSLLLILGSGVSYLTNRSNFSLPLLGAAAGLGVTGYFITRLQRGNFKIGKKYRLNYIAVKPR